MPKRIQRKRTKGWRMPEGAVYVGRPTKFGNPFAVGEPGWVGHWRALDRAHAVELFRELTTSTDFHARVRRDLAGSDLVCWCPLEDEHGNRVPCHADVLLEIANEKDADVR